MSGPFGSSQWMYSSASGFYPHNIDQSLRFNSADTAYLTKTFPSTAGNQKLLPSVVGLNLVRLAAYNNLYLVLMLAL